LQQQYHIPVLLNEVIEGLQLKPSGVYVDCTFGGGGHSKAILEQLGEQGRLIAFDQDEDAEKNIIADKRFLFIRQNFRHTERFLRLNEIKVVDGILADLGVSSHHFNEAERGFSTRFNGKLDMRMDKRQKLTAFDIISTYPAERLQTIFSEYGEVSNAKTLAHRIVSARQNVSIETIDSFKNVIREIVKGNPNKYLAQVFQALRIEVNEEKFALIELLQQVPTLLKPGGRVAIITFHSLEDRLVKNFFRRGSITEQEQNPFLNTEPANELKVITKKPVTPSDLELKANPRARSAKLRIAEKMMMI
jgi:16S rRNA (cytosine1402-N4)-methyltransferase